MQPQTPEFELLPYQQIGRDWLASHKQILLGDDMGVGKSAQAIAAADKLNAENILIVCPAIARINWAREFDRFSLYQRKQRVLLSGEPPALDDQLVIVSFDLLLRDPVHRHVIGRQWDVVIVDEAHFLKEPTAERTKRVLGKHGIIHKAARFWPMSGTFAPNHVGELWVWMYLFGYTTLKRDAFIRRYCTVRETPYGLKVMGNNPATLDELRGFIKQIMLRRTKEQVMPELPPLTLTEVNVEPSPVDMEQWFFDYWIGGGDASVLKAVTEQESRLRNLWDAVSTSRTPEKDRVSMLPGIDSSVSVLRRYTGMQKVQAVVEMVKNELDNGLDKIVIFAVHRDVIVTLRDGLKDYNALLLFGGTPPEKRQRHIDKFQNSAKHRVFVGQIHACGVAISLTAANEILFVESDWVPANNAQAMMRVYRKGQTRPVRARFVSLEGSIDKDIQLALRRKTKNLLEAFE